MTQPVDYEEKARVRVSNSGWNHKNTAGNYSLVCGIIADLLREIDDLNGKLARIDKAMAFRFVPDYKQEEVKEMTVGEVEKELGYRIKIVKGER